MNSPLQEKLLTYFASPEKLKEVLSAYSSDVMMRAASLLRRQEPVKRISFPELKLEHSAAVVPGDGPFQVRYPGLVH